MKVATAEVSVGLWVIMLANWAVLCRGALRVGFYGGKCGIADVEGTVAGVVTGQFVRDPTIVASLLRLQFHDCIVGVSSSFSFCTFEYLFVFFSHSMQEKHVQPFINSIDKQALCGPL